MFFETPVFIGIRGGVVFLKSSLTRIDCGKERTKFFPHSQTKTLCGSSVPAHRSVLAHRCATKITQRKRSRHRGPQREKNLRN